MPGRDIFIPAGERKGGWPSFDRVLVGLLLDFLSHCGFLSRYIKVAGATRPSASISKSGPVRSMTERLGCNRARVSVLGSMEGVQWRREDRKKLVKVGSAAESVSQKLTPQVLRH